MSCRGITPRLVSSWYKCLHSLHARMAGKPGRFHDLYRRDGGNSFLSRSQGKLVWDRGHQRNCYNRPCVTFRLLRRNKKCDRYLQKTNCGRHWLLQGRCGLIRNCLQHHIHLREECLFESSRKWARHTRTISWWGRRRLFKRLPLKVSSHQGVKVGHKTVASHFKFWFSWQTQDRLVTWDETAKPSEKNQWYDNNRIRWAYVGFIAKKSTE